MKYVICCLQFCSNVASDLFYLCRNPALIHSLSPGATMGKVYFWLAPNTRLELNAIVDLNIFIAYRHEFFWLIHCPNFKDGKPVCSHRHTKKKKKSNSSKGLPLPIDSDFPGAKENKDSQLKILKSIHGDLPFFFWVFLVCFLVFFGCCSFHAKLFSYNTARKNMGQEVCSTEICCKIPLLPGLLPDLQ